MDNTRRDYLKRGIQSLGDASQNLERAIAAIKIALSQYGHTAEIEVINDTLVEVRQAMLERYTIGDYDYFLNQGSKDNGDKKESGQKDVG